ncbi:MAG: glycosyltransferase [Paludibacteraceae bacterium]|nr:glycosyltransferase [Paludibacteraceae bacterium]
MRVLYLSAWYPTERDQMAGLFVRKHKEAVERQGADVRVAYNEEKNAFRSLMMLWREVKQWMKEGWVPDVVQVNVLSKHALIAYWLKQRYNVPYIIVEHWSGYLPQNFSIRGGWHLNLMKILAREAYCILPVSLNLQSAMKKCGIQNARWERIHNVVDDFFYRRSTDGRPTVDRQSTETSPRDITEKRLRNERCHLLHVSCFDEKAKNVKGLLRAVREVAERRQDFTLTLVGNGADWVADRAYAESLHFPDGMLIWTGEQTPQEVCQWMQQSDVFVLFSNYENAPVVLSESLAAGCPVIATSVGGIPEIINNQCGVLVTPRDEKALAREINRMLDHFNDYDKHTIRSLGVQYDYQSVGEKLYAIYKQAVGE